MLLLNHKRTTSSLAPPCIIWLAIKNKRLPNSQQYSVYLIYLIFCMTNCEIKNDVERQILGFIYSLTLKLTTKQDRKPLSFSLTNFLSFIIFTILRINYIIKKHFKKSCDYKRRKSSYLFTYGTISFSIWTERIRNFDKCSHFFRYICESSKRSFIKVIPETI